MFAMIVLAAVLSQPPHAPPVKESKPAVQADAGSLVKGDYTWAAKYKGHRWLFPLDTSPAVAEAIFKAMKAEIDGTTPKPMPAAPALACTWVWNGRNYVQQCPNAK